MLKGILFDVDGVLLDSEKLYFRVVQETFSQYGINIGKDEYVRRWMIEQTTSPGIIRDYNLSVSLAEARKRKDEIASRLVDEELEMNPHAMDMLTQLHGRYPLGAVSSASGIELDRNLGKFGLGRFFRVRVTSDDVNRTKPHPEPYQLGARLLDVEPHDVVVVEDNPSGVKSAKGAGCKVVAYPNGFTLGMDFSDADAVIESLAEVNEDMLRSLVG